MLFLESTRHVILHVLVLVRRAWQGTRHETSTRQCIRLHVLGKAHDIHHSHGSVSGCTCLRLGWWCHQRRDQVGKLDGEWANWAQPHELVRSGNSCTEWHGCVEACPCTVLR